MGTVRKIIFVIALIVLLISRYKLGKSLSLSVAGFTLYALSGIAMVYIVLKSLEAVISGRDNLI